MNSHSETDRTTAGFGRNTVGAIAVTLAILVGGFAGPTNARAETCNYEGCFYRFPNGVLAYRNARTWERAASTTTYTGRCLYAGNTLEGCYVPHASGRTGYVVQAQNGKNYFLSYANDTAHGWSFTPYDNLFYMSLDAFLVLSDWSDSGDANAAANALLGQLALQPDSNAWFYNALSNIYAPRGVFP